MYERRYAGAELLKRVYSVDSPLPWRQMPLWHHMLQWRHVPPINMMMILKLVLPGFEWVATTCWGQYPPGELLVKVRSEAIVPRRLPSPYGSCRACRTCGSRFPDPTGVWNSAGIPPSLGNRCAIPTAPTGPEAMLFFNVDMDLSHNHNI